MLRLANVRRSLQSLGAPFVTHFVRYSGRLALPLVAFATCAHSLRSFALVAKSPFGRLTFPLVAFATCAHSLRSFALVAKASFGRLATCAHSIHSFALVAKASFGRLATCAHSIHSFALVAPKGRSIGSYCELQVVLSEAQIQLSLLHHSCSIGIALLTRHS